jgi:hypothetical protein
MICVGAIARRHVGMVFQRPDPFPTMSIAQNVAAGLRFGPREQRRAARTGEVVERSLRQAGLWDEVKHRLEKPGPVRSPHDALGHAAHGETSMVAVQMQPQPSPRRNLRRQQTLLDVLRR